jgi:hypothetical protein
MEPIPPSSMRFYLQSALALILLLLVTLRMEPSQALRALQGGILFGLALAGVKMLLRHYKIRWPPGRH